MCNAMSTYSNKNTKVMDRINELCRLCLVKDQVNKPIFNEQIFAKITSYLPVKVSRDDNLPKKICDGCCDKLDLIEVFRSVSVNSEKQLLSWLNQCTNLLNEDSPANSKSLNVVTVKVETCDEQPANKTPLYEADESDVDDDLEGAMLVTKEEQEDVEDPSDVVKASSPSVQNELISPAEAPFFQSVKEESQIKDCTVDFQVNNEIAEKDLEIENEACYDNRFKKLTIDTPTDKQMDRSTTICDPPKPSYECKLCRKIYKNRKSYSTHLYMHKQSKTKCQFCDKFFHRGAMTIHVASIHEKKRTFACSWCDYIGPTKYTLENHTIHKHTKNFPFKCDVCDQGFISKTVMGMHQRVEHLKLKYVCEICNKSFKSKWAHDVHVRSHAPGFIPSKCDICGKTFESKGYLKTHISKKHSTCCDVCGKTMTTAWFQTHKLIHEGVKTVFCEHCGKGFTKKQDLVVHMRIHTNEKPYKCEFCKKCFNQRSSFTRHLRIHTGERPFKCDVCKRDFVSSSTKRTHVCRGPPDQ